MLHPFKVGFIAVALTWTVSMFSPCYGQRGSQKSDPPKAFSNPTQGFPGFFDSNFADKGSLVVEWPPIVLPIIPMPSIAIDYGVSDTLTVGTNAVLTAGPFLFKGKGISLKARSLAYGSPTVQAAATAYGGYMTAGDFTTSWQMFTSNTSWKVAENHIVSAQAMFLNFSLEIGKQSHSDYTNFSFSTLGVGGGYQYLFSEHTAFSTYILGPAWLSVEADTLAANLSQNLDIRSGKLLWGIARASLDVRVKDSVYSIGGMYVEGFITTVIPWVSATTRW